MTPERTEQLLRHARTALTIHKQMPPDLRAGGLPNIMLGADEAIELLETCASVTRMLAQINADAPQPDYTAINAPITEQEVFNMLSHGSFAPLASQPKRRGRKKGSKNKPRVQVAQGIPVEPVEQPAFTVKPRVLSDRYEELSQQYRAETDPKVKAEIKERMERVKQREIGEIMKAADKPAPVREFKPFGTHNRFQD